MSLLGRGEGTPGNDSSGTSGDSGDDDEILSDAEDDVSNHNGDDSEQSGSKEGSDVAMATRMKRKRKRKLHEWV